MSLYLRNVFFAGVLGAAAVYFGVSGWLSDRASKATPTPTTCSELARSGPPGNLHIELTDCVLAKNFVKSARHDEIWIEARPPARSEGRRIIIKTFYSKRLDLPGMAAWRGVVRRASTLADEGEAMRELRAEDPWILELGDRPGSPASRAVTVLIGLVLLAVAGYYLKLESADWT